MNKRFSQFVMVAALLCASAFGQNTSTFGKIVAGAASCQSSNCVYYQLPLGTPWVVVTVTGTWSGTINLASINAPNANYTNLNTLTWNQMASTTVNGAWSVATGGATFLLVEASAWTSGTASVTMTSSQTGSPLSNPVFLGQITANGFVSAGPNHGITIPAGTAVPGAAGEVVYASDPTNGNAEVNEAGTGLARVCTATNGVCGAGGGPVASISFTTTGGSFAPILACTGSCTVLWTFGDGTTSTTLTPNHTFTNGAVQNANTLVVTPWSALTGINIGFDNSDAPEPGAPYVSVFPSNLFASLGQQNVTAVSGLALATGLVGFSASNNPLSSIDLHGLTALTDFECYQCGNLTSVNVNGDRALLRLEVEATNVASVDLSTTPAMTDFRSARNTALSSVNTGASGFLSHIWHWCLNRDQNLPQQNIAQFPNLVESYLYNSGQTGTLQTSSTTVAFIDADNCVSATLPFCANSPAGKANAYTAINVPNSFPNPPPACSLTPCGRLTVAGNQVTSVNITNDPGLFYLDLSSNPLSSATVDATLNTLNGFGTSGGTVNLLNTSPATTASSAAVTALEGRGWNVQVASGTPTATTPTIAINTPSSGLATISDTQAGVTLNYCIDSVNACSPATAYTTPVAFTSGFIRAQATLASWNPSSIASVSFASGGSASGYVQSNYGTNTTSVGFTSQVTAGDCLIGFAHTASGTSSLNMSDTIGSAWTDSGFGVVPISSGGGCVVESAPAKATGAETINVNTGVLGLQIYEIKGYTCAKDVAAQLANGTSGSGSFNNIVLPTVITNGADFVFAGAAAQTGPLSAGGSGSPPSISWTGDHQGFSQYQIQSAAGTAGGPLVSDATASDNVCSIMWATPPGQSTGGTVTITITPSTLPSGTLSTAYSQTLTASGGTTPYTFTVLSGTLPAGLSLSAGGVLSGTPSAAGTSSFVVQAQDANSNKGTQSYSLTINSSSTPVAYVGSASIAGAANPLSITIGGTGHLILAGAHFAAGSPSIADSLHNTWTDSGYGAVASASSPGLTYVQVWTTCTTASGADTVTVSGTIGGGGTLQTYEFKNVSCTIDQKSVRANANSTSGSNNENTPAITTTGADLVFGFFGAFNGPLVAGTGFTSPTGDTGGLGEYLIQGSAGSATCQATTGGGTAGDSYSGICLSFVP